MWERLGATEELEIGNIQEEATYDDLIILKEEPVIKPTDFFPHLKSLLSIQIKINVFILKYFVKYYTGLHCCHMYARPLVCNSDLF